MAPVPRSSRVAVYSRQSLAAAVLCLILVSCGAPSTQPSTDQCAPLVAAGITTATTRSLPISTSSRSVSDYAGTWSGRYHLTGCVHVCGSGPDVCQNYLAPVPGAGSFGLALRLAPDGSGSMDLLDNTATIIIATGPVLATVDESNVLAINGTMNTPNPSEPRQAVVSGWSSTLVPDGTSMSGRFTQAESSRNAFGPQQYRYDCELVNFQRSKS
jgi:hypothetical protein